MRRVLRLKKKLIAVFLTLCEWLNMTAMVPPTRAAWVSGRYRFVSVYFSAPSP
jgi:hypothetical protein